MDVITGVLHFSFNPNCEPAAFLANFATKDPGTQTTWNSMMHIPNRILNSATGIPEATFAQLKSNYPLVTAPGTGGEACLQKCGLTFNAVSPTQPYLSLPSVSHLMSCTCRIQALVQPWQDASLFAIICITIRSIMKELQKLAVCIKQYLYLLTRRPFCLQSLMRDCRQLACSALAFHQYSL